MLVDHGDILARLSAKVVERPESSPNLLDPRAHWLLKSAVEQEHDKFQSSLQSDSGSADLLRSWLAQPNLAKSKTWKQVFGCYPPRGVIARVARRVQAELHETSQFSGYVSLRDFKREVKRLMKWYRTGRKKTRRRRGIRRTSKSPLRLTQPRSVWSNKVKAHYKRLLKPLRLEGLWEWHKVAMALVAANIPVQSGTIPVERYWASLLEMLPDQARHMSELWFHILSMVSFLRFNIRHFRAGSLPTWCRGDSLLAQRLDGLAACLRVEEGDDTSHLDSLFEPFQN